MHYAELDFTAPEAVRGYVRAEIATPEQVRALRAWHRRHDTRHTEFEAHGGTQGREWADRLAAEMDRMDREKTVTLKLNSDALAAIAQSIAEHAAAQKPERDPDATRCPGEAITLAASEPLSKSVNQIARVGQFKGHGAGPFEFTSQVFDRIIRNFRTTKNQAIPVDYEHATEMVDGSVMQRGAPAVGWITDLDNRGEDGLWGSFEWVDPEAVEHVRSGRYKFLSPAVVFAARHPETGEDIGPKLTSAALTNRPFLDGMAPLTASEKQPAETAHAASLEPSDVHVPGAATATPQPKEKHMAEEMSAAQKKLRSLAAKLGIKLAEHDEPDGDEMMKSLDDLMSERDGLKKASEARMRADAESVVALRVKEGVIKEGAKDKAIALALSDRASFDAFFPAPPPPAEKPAPDAALMSDRVAPRGGQTPERLGAFAEQKDHSKEADKRARVLMSENKDLSYENALIRASRELSAQNRDALLARIGG